MMHCFAGRDAGRACAFDAETHTCNASSISFRIAISVFCVYR